MAEPYMTSISNSAIEKIRNWANQQQAAGRRVDPNMIESMMKASLSAEADRASSNYARNKELTLREQGMAADEAYRNKALESGEKASTMGAIGSLGTTYLGLNYLKGKGGSSGSGPSALETAGGKLLNYGKNAVGKVKDLFGTGDAVSAGTSAGTNITAGSLGDSVGDYGSLDNVTLESMQGVNPAGDYGTPDTSFGPSFGGALASYAGGRIVGHSDIGRETGKVLLAGQGGESERGAAAGGLAAGGATYLAGGDVLSIGLNAILGAFGGSKLGWG